MIIKVGRKLQDYNDSIFNVLSILVGLSIGFITAKIHTDQVSGSSYAGRSSASEIDDSCKINLSLVSVQLPG